jgi:hypothetical protein
MDKYADKTQAIIGLQRRGYDQDFSLTGEGILYLQKSELIWPEEFEIVETYRFENTKSLNDSYIIYAIRSFEREVNGILMTSFNSFNKNISIHLWAKLGRHLNV